jgi:hypothetical protein
MHQFPTPAVKILENNCGDRGHAVTQLVEALRYKPEELEGCGFDSRWCNWDFSLT